MAAGPNTLLRYIRGLVHRPNADEFSDAALLSRFIKNRDESAFAALVDRHGALVLHVCRRVLGNFHDTEDAFQATFLVLAHKAASVRRPESLAAWLHGVAHRAAIKARSTRQRLQTISCQSDNVILSSADRHPDPPADLSVRESLEIIDEELERLPEVYRLPVILCGLESRSLEEAARQLGWTVGSVKGRLERGRARLHARLVRRGATLSAVLTAAEASREAASAAAVVARLLAGTARAAVAFAARQPALAGEVSSEAVTLAGQLLRDMAFAKLRIAVLLLPVMLLLTTGLVLYLAAPAPSPDAAQVQPAPDAGNQPAVAPDEGDMPIAVSGRVLDPEGVPIPGAKLYVGFSANKNPPEVRLRPLTFPPRTATGLDGRFQFTFTKSELDAGGLDHSLPAVIAVKDGYGPDWAAIKDSGGGVEFNLKLVKDVPVEGRILNQNKEPVAGAKLFVWKVESCSEEALTRVLQADCLPPGDPWRGPLPGQPSGVTTDADGRFRLMGFGRERLVTLVLEAPGMRRTYLQAATRVSGPPPLPKVGIYLANFEYVAPAVRGIRGVVRDKATGRPIAGVKMNAQAIPGPAVASPFTFFTDNTGSYEIFVPPEPTGWGLDAQPESGQHYFASYVSLEVKPGPDAIAADFDLVSGILVSGRIKESPMGKAPKAAVVEYHPLFPNPHSAKHADDHMAKSSCVVEPDGSFRLAVLPGPGVVCVAASPRDWYAVALVDEKELAGLVKDGINREFGYNLRTAVGARQSIAIVSMYHTLALINPREGAEAPALDLTVQRARPIRGTVVGPNGEALTGVAVVGLSAHPALVFPETASFTVRGLNAHSTRNVYFYHAKLELGKTLTMRGDETEPVAVQLEPCGSVVGRLLDKSAKPTPGLGISFNSRDGLFGDQAQTDQKGRFRAQLIPGLEYRLYPPRPLLRDSETVIVQSGQTKDLGDLTLGD
jgi:RNA polymerase sigma factor (sigma-70 family)